AGCGKTYQRATLLKGFTGGANEALADDGAHGAAHEAELEGTGHYGHALKPATHGYQCILLAGLLLRAGQAILVFLAVAELQAIHRFQLRTKLLTPFGIEKQLQTRTSTDAHVVIALGANVESLLQLRAIEHRITGRALVPETFRHRALLDLGTHDRG